MQPAWFKNNSRLARRSRVPLCHQGPPVLQDAYNQYTHMYAYVCRYVNALIVRRLYYPKKLCCTQFLTLSLKRNTNGWFYITFLVIKNYVNQLDFECRYI